jgi:hypothetical protein
MWNIYIYIYYLYCGIYIYIRPHVIVPFIYIYTYHKIYMHVHTVSTQHSIHSPQEPVRGHPQVENMYVTPYIKDDTQCGCVVNSPYNRTCGARAVNVL